MPKTRMNTPLSEMLVTFTNSRLTAYVEPVRKGTAKGEQIGMKRKKYHATLLALTEHKVRDQAKELKIPVKLLGKWRTEPAFRQQVLAHKFAFERLTLVACITGNAILKAVHAKES